MNFLDVAKGAFGFLVLLLFMTFGNKLTIYISNRLISHAKKRIKYNICTG
jgi:hypothetical protein